MSTWTMQQAIETQFEVWMKERRERGIRATPYNALQCILHTTTEDFPKEMTKQFEICIRALFGKVQLAVQQKIYGW